MSLPVKHLYEFEQFRLDIEERTLSREDTLVEMTPKAFDLLSVLVENAGKLVSKEELMTKVWEDSFVEESNLTFNIRQVRKLLGDDAQNPTYIKTVPRHGYRFVAPVTVEESDLSEPLTVEEPDFSEPVIVKGPDLSEDAAKRPVALIAPVDDARKVPSRPIFYSAVFVFAVTSLLTVGFFAYQNRPSYLNYGPNAAGATFRDLSFEQIVKSDKYTTASISTNGKYVAYINTVNDQQSLWLRQMASGQSTEIVPAENGVKIQRVKISSDGEYVYFSRKLGTEDAHLDRVPIFGGVIDLNVVAGPDTQFDVSSDASLVAFPKTEDNKTSLTVTRAGGGGESKTIFETKDAITGNSFSPDGKTMAFATGKLVSGDQLFGVYTIGTDGGTPVSVTDQRWNYIRDVVWLPDGSGLLITASSAANSPRQLWKIDLSNGEARRASETENSLDHISITKDQRNILLTSDSLSSKLYAAPMDDIDSARPIVPGYLGVSWTSEGHIVYSAFNGNDDIWCVSPDGKTQMQLTTQSSMDFRPTVTPDGRYIVFISDRGGRMNIWRMNTDGTEPFQLTNGNGESFPTIAGDGSYVVFNSIEDGKHWRVPITGGDPSPMQFEAAGKMSISPDGTKFAHFVGKSHEKKLVLETLEGGQVVREFELPSGHFAGHDIVWSRDGKALYYVAQEKNGASNIWTQPIDRSAQKKITNYNSEGIFYFEFSQDNSQLAFTRGSWNFQIMIASAN